jgi:hypothetical protein
MDIWQHNGMQNSTSLRMLTSLCTLDFYVFGHNKQELNIQIRVGLGGIVKIQVVCYGLVTDYVPKQVFHGFHGSMRAESPDQVLPKLAEAIWTSLEECPFTSICELARATELAPSRVDSHLTQKLGYIARHLC